MNQPSITIACPISSRGWIIPHYLEHIYAIDYPKQLISLYFLLNNSKDNSQQILEQFKSLHSNEYNSITIDTYKSHKIVPQDERTDEIRKKYIYDHLSNLRNKILSITTTDYLLSCDSDILVPNNILRKLLSHNVDICSSLIWNGYIFNPSQPWKYPNILKFNEHGVFEHVQNYYVKNAPNLTESKLIEIHASGAVILMSKEVAKSTRYSYHDQGEDMSWSVDCLKKGYKIYCDASCFSRHMMNEELLQQYIESKNIVSV